MYLLVFIRWWPRTVCSFILVIVAFFAPSIRNTRIVKTTITMICDICVLNSIIKWVNSTLQTILFLFIEAIIQLCGHHFMDYLLWIAYIWLRNIFWYFLFACIWWKDLGRKNLYIFRYSRAFITIIIVLYFLQIISNCAMQLLFWCFFWDWKFIRW